MNNDRLKFRLYDNVRKRYVDFDAQETAQIFLDVNESCLYQRDLDDEILYVHDFHNDDFIIEQCTGLRDKNGNLIFEGDIVRYWWNQKTNTGTIFWNNKFARFCIANNEIHCPEDSDCLMFLADKKIIEIIGNIHTQKAVE